MIFKPKTRIILFDTQSPRMDTDELFDIILSPSFYWVKRVELPVKYLHEVKKLLPSLFEDILPKGEYSYSAYRDGDAYMVFAYDDKFIIRALNEKGVKPAQINKVYFAQSEFGSFKNAITLGHGSVMIVQNDVLVKLPASFSDSTKLLDLDRHRFSSHSIPLARYSHIADKKSMTLFASFMLILIVSLVAEWGIVYAKTAKIETKTADIFQKYHLKSSMMQNSAILDRLQKRYERQSKIRTAAAALFDLKLKSGEKMTRFDLTSGAVKAEFTTASAKRAEAIALQLKESVAAFTKKYNNGVLSLEFAL